MGTLNYTSALLNTLRWRGDPAADDLIAALAARHQIGTVSAVLHHLVTNRQPPPDALPEDVRAWWLAQACLPAWVDRSRLERGLAFAVEHGVQLNLVLSTAAMVLCYAGWRGARVLTFTHRLEYDPTRRVNETAQFLLWVMAPNSFDAGGEALPAILKVRLIHAAVRHLIHASGRWPMHTLGEPICQADLLLALSAFSWFVLKSLRTLGLVIPDSEAEDYLYVWRVVGELLGIEAAVLPERLADHEALLRELYAGELGPSAEGVRLTHALLDLHASLLPATWLRGAVDAIVRLLLGDQVADWMEVPRSRWDRVLAHERGVGRVFGMAGRHAGVAGRLVNHLGERLLEREVDVYAGHRRTALDIPAGLRQHWEQTGKLNSVTITYGDVAPLLEARAGP